MDNEDEPMVADESEDSCDSDSENIDDEPIDHNSIPEHSNMRSNQKEESHESSFRDPELAHLQKVDIFLQQLPFFDKVKSCGFKTFEEIKKNLAKSIVFNEIRPGFGHWTNRLIVFINEYGLFFTKEDHIKLIKLFINVILTPHIDLPIVQICLQVLNELLKSVYNL